MTPHHRAAIGAAILLALVGLAGCGGTGDPDPTTTDDASGSLGTADPTATTPSAEPSENLDGTIFLLGVGTSAGGVYYLHDGNLTPVHPDTSFAFFQSVTMSPNGKRIAYIDADGAGAAGQLSVQTEYGGPPVLIGPNTINNSYLPQWAPDSNSVIVAYGTGQRGRLDVTTGAITPITTVSGCCLGRFSPDLTYAILTSGTNSSVVRVDGSSSTPALAPAGKEFNRIQSLSPDGRHAIALLKNPGDPAGDAGRVLAANAIVDTVTGSSLPIPGGGTLETGFYLVSGNAVLRVTAGGVDKVVLASPSGTVLDEVTVPASGADLVLLGYAPPG